MPIDVVAVGASAGGVEALTTLVGQLPVGFPASVLIVMHVAEGGRSVLAAILDRSCALEATSARDGETMEAGRVYVSPPAHHLTIEGGTLHLRQSPRENGHRPAVDPLFRSVAHAYGPRAAGVVLSGARDDGTAGLHEIKQRGGMAIVQNPQEALYAGMPRNAMRRVQVDAVLPLQEIGFALARLAGSPRTRPAAPPRPGAPAAFPDLASSATASRFTCPDCGGVLFELRHGSVERYACTVGHMYSFESLVEGQAHRLESALWAAVRNLEERAVLLRQLERHSHAAAGVQAIEDHARDVEERARAIRAAIQRVAHGWRIDEREPAHTDVAESVR